MDEHRGIIFHIGYAEFNLGNKRYCRDAAFYGATIKNNYFTYIQKESIPPLKGELGPHTTGLFDLKGELSWPAVNDLMQHASDGNGLYYGFFGVGQSDESYLNTSQKAIIMSRSVLREAFKMLNLNEEELYVFSGLHKNKESHMHVHFQFWEKGAEKSDYRKKYNTDMCYEMGKFIERYLEEHQPEIPDTKATMCYLKDTRPYESNNSIKNEISNILLRTVDLVPAGFRSMYRELKDGEIKENTDRIYMLLLRADIDAQKVEKEFYLKAGKVTEEKENAESEDSEKNTEQLNKHHMRAEEKILNAFENLRNERRKKKKSNEKERIIRGFYNSGRDYILSCVSELRSKIDDNMSSNFTKANDEGRKLHLQIVEFRTNKTSEALIRGFKPYLIKMSEHYLGKSMAKEIGMQKTSEKEKIRMET